MICKELRPKLRDIFVLIWLGMVVVMMESSDKMWSCWFLSFFSILLEKGIANHFTFLPWESHEQYEKEKDRTLRDELPRSTGAQYATGDQWRNNSRKKEETEPKQKQHPVVDVTGDRSKVPCYKEQYCIGTWNVRSMNQGKLEVVKPEMARVNVDILGMSELK